MMKQFEKCQRVLVLLITSLLVATTWAVDESYIMNVNLTDEVQQIDLSTDVIPVKMTYVDYNTPNDVLGELETIQVGFNKVPSIGGTISFGNTGWGVNKIGVLKVDVSAISGSIQKATLKAKISGSTDSKRTTGWGVALTDNTWSADLTYTTVSTWTVSALLNGGTQVWTTTKSSTIFEDASWGITEALSTGQTSATILVYETAAAGGYMKEAYVEVEYEPFVIKDSIEDKTINEEEWQLLKTAYTTMGEGNGWKRPWDFSGTNTSARVLPGVTVENGHVKAITLTDNNLTGTFPVLLLSLPYLEELNVSNNALSGDIGVTMAAYVKMNPSAKIALKHVNISCNQFTGNIGLFAACLPNLQSLDASGNCLEDVYPMISPNVTSLNIGQQTINRIVELDLSNLTVEAMAGKLPSILLYNHAKQTFIPEISILCTTGDLTDYLNNWSIILSYKNGKATVPYASDANVYYGQSGDVLNVGVVDDDGSLEGTTFRIKLNFDNGDANFDGLVNVLDVQTDIMYIFENFKTRPFNFTAANQWPDEQINVQDIVTLVNLIFETKTSAAPSLRRSASTSEAEAIVFCRNGSLIVNTTRPVAAFDITLSGCSNINVKAFSQQGFLCESRKTRDGLRLIGYSLSGNTLPVGETVVGLTNTNVATVYSIQLADTDALEIVSAVDDGNSTGISTISTDMPSCEEIYRIPLGDGHVISIDSQGRKTLINNSKTVK